MNTLVGGFRRLSVPTAAIVAVMLVVLPILVITLQANATRHRDNAADVADPIASAVAELDSSVLRLVTVARLRVGGGDVDDGMYDSNRASVLHAAEDLEAATSGTIFGTEAADIAGRAARLLERYDTVEPADLADDALWNLFGDGPLGQLHAQSNRLEEQVLDYRDDELSAARQLDRISAATLVAVSAAGAVAVVFFARAIAVQSRSERVIRHREETQAALAEFGRRALVSRLDIQALRREAVNRAAETLEVEYVALFELLPEGERLELRNGYGWEPEVVGRLEVDTDRSSHAGYTMLQDQPVPFVDLETERRFESSELVSRGIRSGVSALIRLPDRTWGVLAAYSTSPREFSEADVFFMRSMANTLSTGMLEREAQLRQRVLIESSVVLAQGLEDEAAALRNVAQVTVPHIADMGLIFLLDEGRLRLAEVAASDDSELHEQFEELRGSIIGDISVVWRAINTNESSIANWLDAGELIATAEGDDPESNTMVGLTLLSVLAAPITARGIPIGGLALICETGRFFPGSDASLARELGRRIGLAVDNARLYRRTAQIAEIREQFTHLVAHELRNPLTSVLGMSQVLRRRHSADSNGLSSEDPRAAQYRPRICGADADRARDVRRTGARRRR